jgi:hypothetical protein
MLAFILRRLAQALVVMGVVALVLDLGVNRIDQESL